MYGKGREDRSEGEEGKMRKRRWERRGEKRKKNRILEEEYSIIYNNIIIVYVYVYVYYIIIV